LTHDAKGVYFPLGKDWRLSPKDLITKLRPPDASAPALLRMRSAAELARHMQAAGTFQEPAQTFPKGQ